MTKEEILTWALNNRCKYESSKEMDFDTHLAIIRIALGEEKYNYFVELYS